MAFAISTVIFVGLGAAYPPLVIDRYKAAKELVAESGARQGDHVRPLRVECPSRM